MTNKLDALRQLRAAMMDFAASAADSKAAKYPSLFKPWKLNTLYLENDRRQYCGKLYKCRQSHTSQPGWEPDLSPALWTVIDPKHDGTLQDPIPASRGMEYIYGLYYLDSEDGGIYLCSRVGEADGSTVILQFLPHELIGQYFVAAES